eukprot:6172668-Pleurochrysis_carterae.AAC.3
MPSSKWTCAAQVKETELRLETVWRDGGTEGRNTRAASCLSQASASESKQMSESVQCSVLSVSAQASGGKKGERRGRTREENESTDGVER